MDLRADYKVPGGKLLRARVRVEAGRISRASVSGDFFAHPERLFEEAEASLVGLTAAEALGQALRAFGRSDLVLFGAAPADIAEALRRALEAAPDSAPSPAGDGGLG